ncbi:MAG TPA: sugar phosphate isomerase/epimerase [Chloroflexota bacterium]|nr:sugar phosphate isomerase/epimerase [Chloroflexota bacterium]
MKLAFSAWAMRKAPVETQLQIVREAGYRGIELVSAEGASLDAVTLDEVGRRGLRKLVQDSGLAVTAVDGHANLIEPDPTRRAANVRRVQAAIDLASELGGPDGAPCVVCMAYGKPETYEEGRESVAQRFSELVAYAAEREVVVALEPHVGQAFDLPEKVAWLMERVNSPHFRLNLDNSHFEVMGRDMDEYVPLLAPYAVHTHVKDQRGRYPEYAFLIPGEGEFDYARYLSALQRAGYQGYVTVEISAQVQTRPGYDPAVAARQSYATLTQAAARAGVVL